MPKIMSVNHLVTEAMYQYDHNKNGVIDLKRPDGIWNRLKNPDERVRSNTTVNSYQEDKLTVSTTVHTMRDLFYAADTNKDGQVTREELLAEVKRFDKNNDGKLEGRNFWEWLTRKTKGELDFFNDEYKEKMTNYGSVDI